jgi:hypothetical protein
VNGISIANNQGMTGSFPSNAAGAPQAAGTNPPAWTVTFTGGSVTAYAICVPN